MYFGFDTDIGMFIMMGTYAFVVLNFVIIGQVALYCKAKARK